MTVSVWQDRSGEYLWADAVVVGAGVVGAYLALALSRLGLDVVVLEARFPAAGATGRNAGMALTGLGEYYTTAIQQYGQEIAHAVWEITLENGRKTRALHDEFGLPYEPCGSLLLAVDEAEAEELRASFDAMRADGLPGVLHTSDPLRRGFAAALEQPQDFGIHPVRFVEAMLRASGCELVQNSEVYALEAEDSGVRVRSRLVTVHARHALLATNAYSPLLHPFFRDKVLPTRAQVLLSAPGPRVLDTLCYANYGFEYFRQLPDGRMLLGGWRKGFVDVEVGYADETTPDVQAGLEGFLRARFPELPAGIDRRWSGVMGFSLDGLPLVGQLEELPQVGYAVGFTGHGLGLGIAAADMLIERLLHGTTDHAFAVERMLTRGEAGG